MFAPGHKVGSGDDVWINGMPKSQWYAQNPTQKPTEFYDETHPYLPTGFTAAPTAQTPAAAQTPVTNGAVGTPSPYPAAAVDLAAPRNPIYSNMTTQLSPTTMTALSGYQGQMPGGMPAAGGPALAKKKPYGGFGGLPFGRKLYGNAF